MKFTSFLIAAIGLSPLIGLQGAETENPEIPLAEVMQDFQTFGAAELEKGRELYMKVCSACHGSEELPAPVPNARRLPKDKMLNGAAPHHLLDTLTNGYKQMPAQPWMKPEEKMYVIHYMREAFFKKWNPTQYTKIDNAYLASLPKDATLKWNKKRQAPQRAAKFDHSEVDHGRAIFGHFEAAPTNVAPKGLIIGLDAGKGVNASKHHALYDLDTGRLVAVNRGKLLNWRDLNYNGEHRIHAKLGGEIALEFSAGLAWAKAGEVSPGRYPDFRDMREQALNGRKYGPLPNKQFEYLGLNLSTPQPSIHYRVEGTEILEMPSILQKKGQPVIVRSLLIKPHSKTLYLRANTKNIFGKVFAPEEKAQFLFKGRINQGMIRIAPNKETFLLHFVASSNRKTTKMVTAEEMPTFTWPQPRTKQTANWSKTTPKADAQVATEIKSLPQEGGFEVQEIALPQEAANPWNARIRPAGIRFLTPQRVAVASWSGGLYLIDDANAATGAEAKIHRIAAGLHQPLGLVVKEGEIFVGCRDQIMRPHDLDGDSVADYYEAFNTDHVLSMHFHEFAGGLDTDREGNFYYVKCSHHADAAWFPRHGTLIKVSADGKRSEIIASGLRSSNGVFVDQDDTVWTTDQEGYWNPQNKIMRVEPGKFHGNMLGWYDPKKISARDEDSVKPMVWLTKNYANSPSEVFRFPNENWGALNGKLAYYEYGQGKIMMLPYEEKNGQVQSLANPLPIAPFVTGIMRGAFHPEDQTLYTCGLFGWGSMRTDIGGLYRIRPTGEPINTVVGFKTEPGKIHLEYSDATAKEVIVTNGLALTSYYIHRSAKYGSDLEDEKVLKITKVEWSKDGKTLTIHSPDLAPTRVLFIDLEVKAKDGSLQVNRYATTIHEL